MPGLRTCRHGAGDNGEGSGAWLAILISLIVERRRKKEIEFNQIKKEEKEEKERRRPRWRMKKHMISLAESSCRQVKVPAVLSPHVANNLSRRYGLMGFRKTQGKLFRFRASLICCVGEVRTESTSTSTHIKWYGYWHNRAMEMIFNQRHTRWREDGDK